MKFISCWSKTDTIYGVSRLDTLKRKLFFLQEKLKSGTTTKFRNWSIGECIRIESEIKSIEDKMRNKK
jgi:hypothetical protein